MFMQSSSDVSVRTAYRTAWLCVGLCVSFEDDGADDDAESGSGSDEQYSGSGEFDDDFFTSDDVTSFKPPLPFDSSDQEMTSLAHRTRCNQLLISLLSAAFAVLLVPLRKFTACSRGLKVL